MRAQSKEQKEKEQKEKEQKQKEQFQANTSRYIKLVDRGETYVWGLFGISVCVPFPFFISIFPFFIYFV